MKIILILILIIFCGAIGYGISGVYKQKKKFYDAYLNFLQDLLTYIGFSASKLSSIIQEEKKVIINKEFNNVLDNYLKVIKSDEELTRENLFLNIKLLNENEQNEMYQFFKSLGKTDVYNQMETIKNRVDVSKKHCEKLAKDCEKYCPLYTKLSILIGLFLALLII